MSQLITNTELLNTQIGKSIIVVSQSIIVVLQTI